MTTSIEEALRSGAVLARVKPIDWRDMTYKGVEEWVGHCALSQSFTIRDEPASSEGGEYRFVVRPILSGRTSFPTADAAKAAAQADYEARILSALSPDPALVALIEELREKFRQSALDYLALDGQATEALEQRAAAEAERDRLKVERDGADAVIAIEREHMGRMGARALAAEADLRGCKIALELAWASNREREAKLAAAHTVLDGWQLVPIEPTLKMERAGEGLGSAYAWYCMLEAAPTPPVFAADDNEWRNVRIGGSSEIVERLADESDPQTIAMKVVAKMRSDATALIAAEAELAKEREQVRGLMKTMAAYSERALAAEAKCDALREALAYAHRGLDRVHTALLNTGPKQAAGEMVAHFRDAAARALTQETPNVGE